MDKDVEDELAELERQLEEEEAKKKPKTKVELPKKENKISSHKENPKNQKYHNESEGLENFLNDNSDLYGNNNNNDYNNKQNVYNNNYQQKNIQNPYNQGKSQNYNNQKIPNKSSQTQQQNQQNKAKIGQQPQKQSNMSQNPSEDIYPVKQEDMYHKLKEMKSLTVLEEEIALCCKIIEFKKKKGLDYDEWDTKKDLAEIQLNNVKGLIENGAMDFEAYKKSIMGEMMYEKKLLKFLENDKISKPYEIKEIRRRIEQRINVISKELNDNVEEEGGAEEKNQAQNKSVKKNEGSSNVNPQKNNYNIPQDTIPQDGEVSSSKHSTPKNQIQVVGNKTQVQNKSKIPPENIIQKKELVTDPNTGKQTYVQKKYVDPKYAQLQKQNSPPNQNIQQKQQQKVMVKPPQNQNLDKTSVNKPNVNVQEKSKTVVVNNNNSEEEKMKYKKVLDILIKEYTEAKEYFKRNNFEQLANKARADIQILLKAKQKLDTGKYKEIQVNSLPKPITPEYIYGCTTSERAEIFKKIMTQLIEDKKGYEEKTNSILEKMKKLHKKELQNALAAVKPKLDEFKSNKEKIIKIIEQLKEKFKDKWTPPPAYQKVVIPEQIEKTSYEGCTFGLGFKAGKTNYDKDKTYIVVKLEISKNRVLTKRIDLKEMGDYNEQWQWQFSSDEFKILPKGFLHVELFRKGFFSDDRKGEGKVELSQIKRGQNFKYPCKIEIESKRVEPMIEFIISPILPKGKKYYETVNKERIQLTKTYPPFTGKCEQIPVQSKTEVQSKNTTKPNNQVNNTTTQKVEKNIVVDKSKFKPEELEDVDYIDNLNSLKVLDFKIKEMEAKMKKIDGRTPKEMRQKKVQMTVKKKQIEMEMGNGSISPKEYMEFLKVQLEHDQLLALYFKQSNEEEKRKSVVGRIVLLNQEIEELKKFTQ